MNVNVSVSVRASMRQSGVLAKAEMWFHQHEKQKTTLLPPSAWVLPRFPKKYFLFFSFYCGLTTSPLTLHMWMCRTDSHSLPTLPCEYVELWYIQNIIETPRVIMWNIHWQLFCLQLEPLYIFRFVCLYLCILLLTHTHCALDNCLIDCTLFSFFVKKH